MPNTAISTLLRSADTTNGGGAGTSFNMAIIYNENLSKIRKNSKKTYKTCLLHFILRQSSSIFA